MKFLKNCDKKEILKLISYSAYGYIFLYFLGAIYVGISLEKPSSIRDIFSGGIFGFLYFTCFIPFAWSFFWLIFFGIENILKKNFKQALFYFIENSIAFIFIIYINFSNDITVIDSMIYTTITILLLTITYIHSQYLIICKKTSWLSLGATSIGTLGVIAYVLLTELLRTI